MLEKFLIAKASGEMESFNVEKFKRSLRNAGASEDLIQKAVKTLEENFTFETAKDIHNFTRDFLKKYNKGISDRYNLKEALRQLGPTGHPFECFVEQVFRHKGYLTQVNYVANGVCVKHELDVIAQKDNNLFLIECKFHNVYGLKTDVKVPLYVKARFDDVKQAWIMFNGDKKQFKQAFVFTNTKFTIDAIMYAECVNLNLIGWSYPEQDNLSQLISKFNLYPITVLSSLNKFAKEFLLENKIVLCKQLKENSKILKDLRMGNSKINEILEEVESVCCRK